MLLGAVRYPAATRGVSTGTPALIFQPAEEGRQGGAEAMPLRRLFERFSPADALFGMHNMPDRSAGAPGFPRI